MSVTQSDKCFEAPNPNPLTLNHHGAPYFTSTAA